MGRYRMVMRLLAVLILSSCGASVRHSTAALQPPVHGIELLREWRGYRQLIPGNQHWPVRAGRLRGLLVASGAQDWGATLNWSGGVGAGRGEYQFFAEGASAVAIYFASEGEGISFLREWSVPTPAGSAAFDAAQFLPETPNPWGLSRSAHLVEVELNGGRGGQGIHSVITDAQLLDGSVEYPIVVEESLLLARARFERWLALQEQARERLVREQRSALPEGFAVKRSRERTMLWPSWYDERGELEVLMAYTRREIAVGPERRSEERPCPPCPCDPRHGCAPCVQCVPDPHPRLVRDRRSLFLSVAAQYRFDRNGTLLHERRYTPYAH